jgi:hypothetical protein
MFHTRFRFACVLILGCALTLAACLRPTPTPATVLPQLTVPVLAPTTYISPTPDLIPDLSCVENSDCALAYRTDRCCACAEIFNREQVENDPRLRYVFEPEGYRYTRWRNLHLPWGCANVMCAPCPPPPFGLWCDSGACRAAQPRQAILAACPAQPPSQPSDWCYTSAAIAAAQSGNLVQALSICEQYTSDVENCKQQVGGTGQTP